MTFIVISVMAIYLYTCAVVIYYILKKFNDIQLDKKKLFTLIMLFEFACIVSTFTRGKDAMKDFGAIPFLVTSLIEIIFISHFFLKSINKKNISYLWIILLFSSLIVVLNPLNNIFTENYLFINLDLFYSYQSIIITTGVLIYFFQLNTKLPSVNLMKDPITNIAFGIFFCHIFQIALNSSYALVKIYSFMNIFLIYEKPLENEDLLYLISVISYGVLNYFLWKSLNLSLSQNKGLSV